MIANDVLAGSFVRDEFPVPTKSSESPGKKKPKSSPVYYETSRSETVAGLFSVDELERSRPHQQHRLATGKLGASRD